ncbi:MAG: rhodanese-like domain-containing protein [Bacteroidetes bacterium]|nr:rhodanese-like domain-containing protein [Bacteroidota bacterium]
MKKFYLVLIALFFYSLTVQAQITKPSKVSFDDYEKLIAEVKEHRKTRLLTLDEFNAEAKKPGVIILDARSDAMYNAKHIKGAIHLNFSDFTQEALAKVIPSYDTKILIYCNNNFEDDRQFFPTKMVMPEVLNTQNILLQKQKGESQNVSIVDPTKENNIQPGVEVIALKPITLALNIPTYTNLYGYGYRNVYELGEFVNIYDKRLEFEGTAVSK